jgi:lipopolysaccharide transport protein LptA
MNRPRTFSSRLALAFLVYLVVARHGSGANLSIPDGAVLTNEPVAHAVTAASPAATNTNRTEITSKQLRMDTDKKIAYFDGDVLVVDPQFQLRSNRLIVFMNQSGAGMEHAEAYDDVIIVQEEQKRKSHSKKAVYTPADGKMVLTGDPQLENDRGITRGEVITIYRTNNIVTVEGNTKTTIDLSEPAPATSQGATNAPSAGTNAIPSKGTN